jgi:hypothetical protein
MPLALFLLFWCSSSQAPYLGLQLAGVAGMAGAAGMTGVVGMAGVAGMAVSGLGPDGDGGRGGGVLHTIRTTIPTIRITIRTILKHIRLSNNNPPYMSSPRISITGISAESPRATIHMLKDVPVDGSRYFRRLHLAQRNECMIYSKSKS